MTHYNDCPSYACFPYNPHTIKINDRNISIERGDCLAYYMKKGFTQVATATDTRGYNYTIYASNRDGIIAIPTDGKK